MVACPQSSAAGVLALLSEPDPVFKKHALQALNPLVPQFWAEISEHIAFMCVSSTRSARAVVHILPHLPERPCMKAKSFRKRPVTLQPFWRAKFTTSSENMTRLCLSLSVLETRSKQKLVVTDPRNTWKRLFVSSLLLLVDTC
jgi:hypothetical protein